MMENNIAIKLYFEVGNLNQFTIDENWRKLVLDIENKVDFLHFNMKNYDSRYFMSLLLTFHDFLFQLSDKDWLILIEKSLPKPRVDRKLIFKNVNNDGEFSDLIFLQKILEINPIGVLRNKLKIDSDELDNCIAFIDSYDFKFKREPDFEEDLRDIYGLEISDLMDYSKKLKFE